MTIARTPGIIVKKQASTQHDQRMKWRPIVLLFTAACASAGATKRNNLVPSSETLAPGVALATFDTVWTVVQRTYVDTGFVSSRWMTVRDSLRPRAMTVTRRAGLEALLASTLAQIHDSHFYIIPAAIASDVGLDDSGDTGEGTTGLSVRIAGDRALVWRVEPGSPAALAAITPGEAVEQVNDRVVRTSIGGILSLPDASRQRALSELDFKLNSGLTAAVGDSVRIRVRKLGQTMSHKRSLVAVPIRGTVSKFGNLPPIAGIVRVTRQPLTVSGVARPPSALAGDAAADCVGTIAFNIWLPALAPELDSAVNRVADCAGIVLDLRGNPGGVGAMVMGFGGYFVGSPVSLGTMRTRDLALRFAINPRILSVRGVRRGPFTGPVAIIVDAMTASTSEIFAAGMQRIGRARIFGQRSAGAALPALMQGLPSGDVFVHAVADFIDPAGHRIEGAGVIPDEIVPLTEKDLSGNVDAPLEAAIRWIASLGRAGYRPAR
jgi:carboxyl-terminal processing protease